MSDVGYYKMNLLICQPEKLGGKDGQAVQPDELYTIISNERIDPFHLWKPRESRVGRAELETMIYSQGNPVLAVPLS